MHERENNVTWFSTLICFVVYDVLCFHQLSYRAVTVALDLLGAVFSFSGWLEADRGCVAKPPRASR